MTDEKVGGPMKNMGGLIMLLYIVMFEILKSCLKCIFGLVKHKKFSWCLQYNSVIIDIVHAYVVLTYLVNIVFIHIFQGIYFVTWANIYHCPMPVKLS